MPFSHPSPSVPSFAHIPFSSFILARQSASCDVFEMTGFGGSRFVDFGGVVGVDLLLLFELSCFGVRVS